MSQRIVIRIAGAAAAALCLAAWGQRADDSGTGVRASRRAELSERVRALNGEALRLAGEDPAKTGLRRSGAAEAIAFPLQHRAASLQELMRADAAEALRVALPPEALARIRATAPEWAPLLEEHGEWEGEVETLVMDSPDLVHHERIHFLTTGERRLEVHMAGEEPEGIECGKRVRFRGVRLGETVAALDAQVTGQVAAAAPACGPKGVQNIAVLLVTFPGVAPPSNVTPATVSFMLFGTSGRSLNGYWNEASYGQTTATGAVYGWYTLDRVYTCDEYYSMRSAAIAAADADVDFRSFNRLFIIFPNPGGCAWAGLSNVGCSSFSSADGTISASSSWMLANYFGSTDSAVKLSAHEGGHSLGLMHSRSRRFNGEPLGPLADTGTISEYGDVHSAMGAWNLGHYTAEQKLKLGWLPSSGVLQVQSPGTFTVKPLEMPAAGYQALQVQRGTGNNAWLWVEFRQPVGNYDTTLNSQVFSGALIHYKDSTTGSYMDLLDFTPATSSFSDPSLGAGSSWQDPYTNVSLAVAGASSSGLTVQVNYGSVPCSQAAPSLAVSPANPGAEPGQSVTYTLSLKNNDSGSCASRTFSLSSTQPQGWPTAFSTSTVTLAPGQSMDVSMTKSVPASAVAGTYPVDAAAQDGTATVTAQASLTVLPPSPPLSVSFQASALSVQSRSSSTFTVQVLRGTTPAAGAAVAFTLTKPDGRTVTSRTIQADSSGLATWTYRFQKRDPTGVYTVTATASFNGQTASATATVTLQ